MTDGRLRKKDRVDSGVNLYVVTQIWPLLAQCIFPLDLGSHFGPLDSL
jgi:hypothetical protein